MSRTRWGVACSLVVGSVAGAGACAESGAARAPAARPAPVAASASTLTIARDCRPPRDRPAAGQAAVDESPEGDVVIVRFSATPPDGPCEALDIVFRLRGEMLVGEPGSQVEIVWSGEGAVPSDAGLSVVVAGRAVPLASERLRTGSRVEIATLTAPGVLARYGHEIRPTLVVAGRRIELSGAQAATLQRFVGRLPAHHAMVRPRRRGVRPASAPAPRSPDDPAEGSGWFCVEANDSADLGKRTSSCHRTSSDCERSRASLLEAKGPAGECVRSPAAVCYRWRLGMRGERSCFYRPSQCRRDETIREEEGRGASTGGCHSIK